MSRLNFSLDAYEPYRTPERAGVREQVFPRVRARRPSLFLIVMVLTLPFAILALTFHF